MRNPFKSEDGKPVMLTGLLQRDIGSRLLGEYYERHLNEHPEFIIIARENGCGVRVFLPDEGISPDDASLMCTKGALRVLSDNGH